MFTRCGASQIGLVSVFEYMEKHSVARMIGAPPGCVGYEEGGQLNGLLEGAGNHNQDVNYSRQNGRLLSIKVYILKPSRTAFSPVLAKQLRELGERLQLARLRRRYSAATVAARAGVTRMTLYKVEKGDPAVGMGTYANVLRVLGLPADLDLIARDDVLGRKLQDLELPVRKIAPARKGDK